MIGDCRITLQEVDHQPLPEIGYHLRRDLWGQGFATEAARECRDYGLAQLKADVLISLIRPENVPSGRVAERNGRKIWKETIRKGLRHSVYAVRREEMPRQHSFMEETGPTANGTGLRRPLAPGS